MRLLDLNPRWLSSGGTGITDLEGNPVPQRDQVAIRFDCPCGCDRPVCLSIQNPPDGKPNDKGGTRWLVDGAFDFKTLTLVPSFQRRIDCSYHGWVRNGEIIEAG